MFKLSVPGRHFATNAVAVLAMVDLVGGDIVTAAQDLSRWDPPAGRGARERRLLDPIAPEVSFDLIDDAYNANPTSLAASLEVLAAATPRDGIGRIKQGRRIAILGDMLEMGSDELTLHAEIAQLSSISDLDLIHCVGPRMRALHDVLPLQQQGEWVEAAEALVAQCAGLVDAGDVVLVKGSKGSKVSLLVDALKKLSHPHRGVDEE